MSFADEIAAARRSAARVGAAHHVGEALRSLRRALPALARADCPDTADTADTALTTVSIAVYAPDGTGRTTDLAVMVDLLQAVFEDIAAAARNPFPRG